MVDGVTEVVSGYTGLQESHSSTYKSVQIDHTNLPSPEKGSILIIWVSRDSEALSSQQLGTTEVWHTIESDGTPNNHKSTNSTFRKNHRKIRHGAYRPRWQHRDCSYAWTRSRHGDRSFNPQKLLHAHRTSQWDIRHLPLDPPIRKLHYLQLWLIFFDIYS